MGEAKTIWNTAAAQAAGGLFGTLLGQAYAGRNDRRQLRQQEALQNLQISGEQKMLGLQKQKELEMWEATGYGAQKDQMKRAGLNPGLLYGMGGGGGQSMGGGAPMPTGGNAPVGGREIQDISGMMMEMQSTLALQNAQKANIDASTANLKIDGLNKAAQAEGTQYDNVVKELLTNRDKDGKPIERPEDDMNRVAVQERVQKMIQTNLENLNIDADTSRIIAQVAQGWKDLDIKERQQKLNELMNEQNMTNKDQDQILGVVNMVLGALTHGLIHFKGRRQSETTESYENKDGIETYRSSQKHYHNKKGR